MSSGRFYWMDFKIFFWVCLVLYVQNTVHSLFQQVCGFLDKRQKGEVAAVIYFPACPAAVSVVKAETFQLKFSSRR